MALGNLSVVGLSGSHRMRVAASATRGYAGEPALFAGTYTSGVASANTVVVTTDAATVIGTDVMAGVFTDSMKVDSAGTVIAQKINVAVPIANVTKIRGRAKTASTVDTESEGIGLLWDFYHIDLTSAVYTFDAAGGDTAAFTVRDFNHIKQTLDVIVDARAQRADIT